MFFLSLFKLSEILKFGLDKLLSSEGSTIDEVDLEAILGETKDGQWVSDALPAAEGGDREQEEGSKLGLEHSRWHSRALLEHEQDEQPWKVLATALGPCYYLEDTAWSKNSSQTDWKFVWLLPWS